MKNRNIPYYVAALMLAMGVSTSFVSCVDTDAPESVTKTRELAIQKLQADAQLQKAVADYNKALADYQEQEGKYNDAQAASKSAAAKAQELLNQITEGALDDKKKAETEKKLAEYEKQRATAEANKLAAELEAKKYEAELQIKKQEVAESLKAALDKLPAELQAAQDLYMGYYVTEGDNAGTFVDGTMQKLAKATDDYNKAVSKYSAPTKATLTADLEYKKANVATAEAAKKAYETLFASDDLKSVAETYANAQEEIKAATKEMETQAAIVTENEKKASARVKELQSEYRDWCATTKVYECSCSEALKNQVFGEKNDVISFWNYKIIYKNGKITVAQSVSDKIEVYKKDLNHNGVLDEDELSEENICDKYDEWAKLASTSWSDGYKINIPNAGNGREGSSEIGSFLTTFVKDYLGRFRDETQIPVRKKAWEDAEKADYYKNLVKQVDGDKTLPDATTDAYKGLATVYDEKLAAWTAIKDSPTATAADKNTAQQAVRTASSNLYGSGHEYLIKPTEEQIRKEAVNSTNLNNNYGPYGKLLVEKDRIADLKEFYEATVSGVPLAKTIYDMGQQLVNDAAAKFAKLQNDLNNDAVYQEAMTAGANAAAAGDAAENKKDMYEGIAKIAANTLNNQTSAITIDEKVVKFSDYENLESVKTVVLAYCQKGIDEAKAEEAQAQADLDAFNKGEYEPYTALAIAKKKLDDATTDNDAAKAYYEEMLKAYSTSSK
jgi:hypothetical protein